jgi:hypothetical protein
MKLFSTLIAPAPAFTASPHVDVRRPKVGALERLPKWMNLPPMILQWLYLSLRYGSVSLPSSANPAITSGGMVGEGKLEYFDIMGPVARAATADYTSLVVMPNSINTALTHMDDAGLRFPIIVKPNVGWCGFGVRLIHNKYSLENYLSTYPQGETLVLQRFVPFDGEAGLFYARHPDEARGRIIGILLRTFPRVIGDGKSTVGELMDKDPRLQRLGRDGLHECTHDRSHIPAPGETVRLATIGSTRVGGLYRDAAAHITPDLERRMDQIARDMTEFHIGRFDVRFESIEKLRAGEFTIIEVNGSGSEAVHAWDPKFSLIQSYRIIFAKQRLLFRIAHAMRKRGHKPIGLMKLARLHVWQQSLIDRYPPSN